MWTQVRRGGKGGGGEARDACSRAQHVLRALRQPETNRLGADALAPIAADRGLSLSAEQNCCLANEEEGKMVIETGRNDYLLHTRFRAAINAG